MLHYKHYITIIYITQKGIIIKKQVLRGREQTAQPFAGPSQHPLQPRSLSSLLCLHRRAEVDVERFGAAALASQVGSTRSEEEPRGESEDAHVARHERERETLQRLLFFMLFSIVILLIDFSTSLCSILTFSLSVGIVNSYLVHSLAATKDQKIFTKLAVHALLKHLWSSFRPLFLVDLGHQFLSTAIISYWILLASQLSTPRIIRCGLWGLFAAEGLSECFMFASRRRN